MNSSVDSFSGTASTVSSAVSSAACASSSSSSSSSASASLSVAAVDTRHFPRAAKLALKLLQGIKQGALELHFPDGQRVRFGSDSSNDSSPVHLRLHNWHLLKQALKSGDIGFAESYIQGHWSSDNLPGLIELFARNRAGLDAVIYGHWWGKLTYLFKHFFSHRNSRAGSRRNIHAHYDIGNTFYRLWLDPSMTYSSALFGEAGALDLVQAQQAKYQRLLDEASGGKPAAQILEIGCGWGGLVEVAARQGHRVTGITLSTEQLEFAQQRLANAGLADEVQLSLTDYRDTQGEFDAVVSIEMFEAVGQEYWGTYFRTVAKRLKPGGRAAIQTITIADELFAQYRRSTDFIQQYIFPGGMLPSPSAFEQAAQHAGLRVERRLRFGLDYARTLALWRTAFHNALPEVRAQGFDERFIRTWDFYLAYCEAGFKAANTDVIQYTLIKE